MRQHLWLQSCRTSCERQRLGYWLWRGFEWLANKMQILPVTKGRCRDNHFWLSIYGCILAPPSESDWTVCAAAMRPYVKLLWPLVSGRVHKNLLKTSITVKIYLYWTPLYCNKLLEGACRWDPFDVVLEHHAPWLPSVLVGLQSESSVNSMLVSQPAFAFKRLFFANARVLCPYMILHSILFMSSIFNVFMHFS